LELNQLGQADIYFDIAYTPDFLPGGDGEQFMSELAKIYGGADKSTRWLMFGSDWIMLGREPGADHYAQAAAAAIRSVPDWGPAQQDLVLHDNLRRFLSRGP
jgi:predicted TIM-barrel fold metal-dependent hydrolase